MRRFGPYAYLNRHERRLADTRHFFIGREMAWRMLHGLLDEAYQDKLDAEARTIARLGRVPENNETREIPARALELEHLARQMARFALHIPIHDRHRKDG